MTSHNALNPWIKWGLFLSALMAFVFSFTQKLDPTVNRIVGTYMNFGHVAAFFLWTYLCLRFIPNLKKAGTGNRLLFAVLFSILGGGLIEVIQHFVGREPSLFDIGSDLIGALLAVLIFQPVDNSSWQRKKYAGVMLLLVIALVMHQDLILVPINEFYQRQQFPILFDANTPFETTRLYEDASRKINVHDDYGRVLEINFDTNTYSTLSIGHFPYDWRGFEVLEIEFYQAETEPWFLTIRVQDMEHSRSDENDFKDRFNKQYRIHSVHQTISIPLQDIIHAPHERVMNLHEMGSIWMFTSSAKQQRTLYLKQIRLR